VSRREEQQLAARLARVLDGQEGRAGDVAVLAAVLERATEPARFEVPEDEIERALRAVRPRIPARRPVVRARPRLALAFGAAAAAAAAVLVITLVRIPGVDIEGKALAALGGAQTILKVEERIVPAVPGTFRPSTRTAWLDPARGLERWKQVSGGRTIEETLVRPGHFSRYLPLQNLIVVASSCRAFASGCADVLDPVAFYRRALLAHGVKETKQAQIAGHSVYRLTLPVQTLPDGVRIDQQVTIDAATYLPREIDWVEQAPGGSPRKVAKIVVGNVERFPRSGVFDPFHLPYVPGVRVVQRTVARTPVHEVGARTISLATARRVRPTLRWLGPRFQVRTFQGEVRTFALTRIEKVRFNTGVAYRLRYGPMTIWSYTTVVPPEIVAERFSVPSKTLPIQGVAHFYSSANGRMVADVQFGRRSVAVVGPIDLLKEGVFDLVQGLRPLR
jgi:hypothetical protein